MIVLPLVDGVTSGDPASAVATVANSPPTLTEPTITSVADAWTNI